MKKFKHWFNENFFHLFHNWSTWKTYVATYGLVDTWKGKYLGSYKKTIQERTCLDCQLKQTRDMG